jgi:flavin-binding protein dodecin
LLQLPTREPNFACGHIPKVVRNRRGREIKLMPKIVKVIEILSESPKSWEEAAQNVVAEASKTLRNIRSVYIKEFSASVDAEKVTSYRVNAKVTFEMERGGQGKR